MTCRLPSEGLKPRRDRKKDAEDGSHTCYSTQGPGGGSERSRRGPGAGDRSKDGLEVPEGIGAEAGGDHAETAPGERSGGTGDRGGARVLEGADDSQAAGDGEPRAPGAAGAGVRRRDYDGEGVHGRAEEESGRGLCPAGVPARGAGGSRLLRGDGRREGRAEEGAEVSDAADGIGEGLRVRVRAVRSGVVPRRTRAGLRGLWLRAEADRLRQPDRGGEAADRWPEGAGRALPGPCEPLRLRGVLRAGRGRARQGGRRGTRPRDPASAFRAGASGREPGGDLRGIASGPREAGRAPDGK